MCFSQVDSRIRRYALGSVMSVYSTVTLASDLFLLGPESPVRQSVPEGLVLPLQSGKGIPLQSRCAPGRSTPDHAVAATRLKAVGFPALQSHPRRLCRA